VRTDIPKGDINLRADHQGASVWQRACMVEATGQEILDALEMGARVTPEENG
jgi:hypothetical protein